MWWTYLLVEIKSVLQQPGLANALANLGSIAVCYVDLVNSLVQPVAHFF